MGEGRRRSRSGAGSVPADRLGRRGRGESVPPVPHAATATHRPSGAARRPERSACGGPQPGGDDLWRDAGRGARVRWSRFLSRNQEPGVLRPKLRVILSGPEVAADEDEASNQARNFMFELTLAWK